MSQAVATRAAPDDPDAPSDPARRTAVPGDDVFVAIDGRAEQFTVSTSGYVLIEGWLADEGCSLLDWQLSAQGLALEIAGSAVLRHARPDVNAAVRDGAVDYGFVLFASVGDPAPLLQLCRLEARSRGLRFAAEITPTLLSDRRVLDRLLSRLGGVEAHAGADIALHGFMAGPAGQAAVELFQRHVETHLAGRSVYRFRPRPVSWSFVTVLFGSTEPVKLQPVLFRSLGIPAGEWIYVCNSPEDAETVLQLGRLVAELYDVPITVIVMPDNVGFGAANNAAVAEAASDAIVLVNPDVYPLSGHAAMLREGLEGSAPPSALRGALLFYDDHNLMHSGMMIDSDPVVRRAALNASGPAGAAASMELLRVEHFDKGVPFEAVLWTQPRAVPAITGAVMAFQRQAFDRLGGFSTRYIYGHYEDADLSLRWAGIGGGEAIGPVMLDHRLRLVHLEGQGSKPRGDHYRGAAIVNRHLFTLRHGAAFARDPAPFTETREIAAAPR